MARYYVIILGLAKNAHDNCGYPCVNYFAIREENHWGSFQYFCISKLGNGRRWGMDRGYMITWEQVTWNACYTF